MIRFYLQIKHFWTLHLLFLLLFLLYGCTPGTLTVPTPSQTSISNVVATPTATASSTSNTTQTGPMAIRIIFQVGQGGSFDSSPSGTQPKNGIKAVRYFDTSSNANPSAINSSNLWLSSFELGITGPSNTASSNLDCANFSNFDVANPPENNIVNCNFINPNATPSIIPSKCGAPSGYFRVSEADCVNSNTAAGTGGPDDGVYFRANFNRSYLGLSENILVSLEYSASALYPAPSNPALCFNSGKFMPENCSDFTWRIFLRNAADINVPPFLLLVPPTFSSILQGLPKISGTGITSKQFILPLATNSNWNVLQVSRTGSKLLSSDLQAYCTSGSFPGKSPLCAGMIFYSITFFRI